MFTKRSYILKQIFSWKLQVCLSMYGLLLDTRKGLTFICLCDLYKIKFRCFCIGTVINCTLKVSNKQCMKIVRIRSFSGPLFPAFILSTERYEVFFRIQSKCGKLRTRKTPNTNIFHAVKNSRLHCLKTIQI